LMHADARHTPSRGVLLPTTCPDAVPRIVELASARMVAAALPLTLAFCIMRATILAHTRQCCNHLAKTSE
jgi:hypothetical protein